MMVKIGKNKMAIGLAFMITLASSKAYAFGIPLLSADMKRLIDSARMILQQVMIIKQEIDSNLAIIKEIQNGGFAAAGAMIFEKIQNGDYDRFGNALSTVKNESQDMAANVQAAEIRKDIEKKKLAAGASKEEAKAYAQQETARRLQEAKEAREKARLAAKEARGENAFNKSYDWLKKNSGVTSGASNALRGVDNGNWGQALAGAANVTGSSINSGGESKLGNIFNDSSYGAGSALNSALSGDWTGAFNDAAHGAGNAAGNATGSQGFGNTIGGLGSLGAGVVDTIGEGGNMGDVIYNATNNSDINSGLGELSEGYGGLQEESKAAAEAQKEAQKKWAEEKKKELDEMAKQEEQRLKQEKQKQCQECMKKNGDSALGCMSYCS